jgi:hypothetical protein
VNSRFIVGFICGIVYTSSWFGTYLIPWPGKGPIWAAACLFSVAILMFFWFRFIIWCKDKWNAN